MKEKVLVSACLVGKNTKYNGKNNFFAEVADYIKDKEVFLVCPEVMGGLSIPRPPAELKVSAREVLLNKKGIVNQEGRDVSCYYIKGVTECEKIVLENNIKKAILKEKSPSCGVKKIYDGKFSHQLIDGNGLLVEVLKKHNITIMTEENLLKERNGLR